MHKTLLSALLTLGLSAPALAQSQSTDIRPNAEQIMGDDITRLVTGNTFSGAYNFTREGKARGFFTEKHFADGRVDYREGDLREDGAWFEIDDSICYRYANSAMSGGCFRVYQVKNCYYFYSTLMQQRPDELDQDYWVARSTLQGETPQCEAAVS